MSAGEDLAKAVREWDAESTAPPRQRDSFADIAGRIKAKADAVRAALARFDREAPVRQAEREFLDAAALWSQTIIAKLQGTYPSEVVYRLGKFLAARAAAGSADVGQGATSKETP